ncbi:MAG TPA: ATP-binding protein [Bryobacteraceae bacterium]|nr:ATP-binding protein [Bryobacteraceae bacterium]
MATRRPVRTPLSRFFEFLVVAATILLAGLGAFQLHFSMPVTAFVFFLLIVITALRLGFWEASAASIVAVACLDYLFTMPLFSFRTDAAGWTALSAFECAALVVSRLSAQVQHQAEIASQQRNNMEQLYELARNILLVDRHQPVGPQIATFIQQAVQIDSVALFDPSPAKVYGAGSSDFDLEEAARNAWLKDTNEDLPDAHTWSRVLRLGHKGIGAIAVRANDISPIVADAIASLAAIALERSRSLEKEMRAEAARQSEQLRTAVLDALAHAFKTPLTTILAASSGLLEGGTLRPQEAELVTLIDDQSVVLNDLTTRLLQTARLEGAAMHLHREESSAAELFEDVLAPFQAQLERRPARIVLPEKDLRVSGDVGLIATALRQLVDNAIKYSDPGSTITISGEVVDGEFLTSVHNEGIPIRAEDRERIFERFYRSPGTEHRAAGTGLGLSITKKIAEAHQGRVWVKSDAKGTTFYFALPLAAKEIRTVAGEAAVQEAR